MPVIKAWLNGWCWLVISSCFTFVLLAVALIALGCCMSMHFNLADKIQSAKQWFYCCVAIIFAEASHNSATELEFCVAAVSYRYNHPVIHPCFGKLRNFSTSSNNIILILINKICTQAKRVHMCRLSNHPHPKRGLECDFLWGGGRSMSEHAVLQFKLCCIPDFVV